MLCVCGAILHGGPETIADHQTLHSEFYLALRGSQTSLGAAASACDRVLSANPEDACALFWEGAALYFRLRDAFERRDFRESERDFRTALGKIDSAISQKPDHLWLRTARGLILLDATREMFQEDALLRKGIADCEQALAGASGLSGRSEHQRGELLFAVAEGAARAGYETQALKYFRRLATEMSGTRYAARASSWLSNRSLTPDESRCLGCHISQH